MYQVMEGFLAGRHGRAELRQAFEGQLASQLPNDKWAHDLLTESIDEMSDDEIRELAAPFHNKTILAATHSVHGFLSGTTKKKDMIQMIKMMPDAYLEIGTVSEPMTREEMLAEIR